MTTQAPTQAIVLFGATGDLAVRMLLPSLYYLEADGLLPDSLKLVGAARSDLDAARYARMAAEAIEARTGKPPDPVVFERLAKRIAYARVDASKPESFAALAPALDGVEQPIFYLSISPTLFEPVCRALTGAGLARPGSRVVVEKPVGRDLQSCRAINAVLAETFGEDGIFRIDHYLGKDAVQNLLALRFGNTLFEPLWTKDTIEHVQITVAETVGVEGRWAYYDEYGAVRDMVQNHLLQLLCLVAMEVPVSLDPEMVRLEKVKVLRSLRPIAGPEVMRETVRGQYAAGVSGTQAVPGYAQEEGGRKSGTETFTAIAAHVDTWRWAGVPFYLRTGKRLPSRASQIVIQFRKVPYSIFGGELPANRLTIRLQPEEDISLTLMNKTALLSREGMQLKPQSLSLNLLETFEPLSRRRIAYERLLLEALAGNQTLFVRADESEAAWKWIDAIVAAWDRYGVEPLPYQSGSWGPAGAFALTERNGHSWVE